MSVELRAHRPPIRTVIRRLIGAVILAAGLTWIPARVVHACSCGFDAYADAIAEADFAFIGAVVVADEPPATITGPVAAVYQFRVERGKGPMATPFAVTTPFATGEPNCGFNMDLGQEWLVIAGGEDGPPRADFCNGTTPVASLDAAALEAIDAALRVTPADFDGPVAPAVVKPPRPAEDADPDAAGATAPGVAAPPLIVIAVVAVIGVASLVAFRRGRT